MRRGPGGDREGAPNLPRASAPFRDLRKLCVAAFSPRSQADEGFSRVKRGPGCFDLLRLPVYYLKTNSIKIEFEACCVF